ncbi:VCBS repeat-containing protein [Streptomyces sp. AV19]|uniref:FG-GAP repeat domain-containing protein n=1 Tax=Streptomyces sp. AV19 TaxID=2793068 RepID=UPI0018FF03BC|nr:VCBS repeat-containing protein [Streptomyces sp. AV19]MBH1938485.1 VCBS repeat-containing protein [Streptomyces sp. AV19]MDG4535134.1 VCBS repeat-containing protein [Streptomyces sp. AV19]
MARISGRGLSRLVTTAAAVTLVGTTAGTALADTPAQDAAATRRAALSSAADAPSAAATRQPTADAPLFNVEGVTRSGEFRYYRPDGKGGLRLGGSSKSAWWKKTKASTNVDHDRDGRMDGTYELRTNGDVLYQGTAGRASRVASGWGGYNTFFTPGDLGGSSGSDLVVRDKKGVLWLYQGSNKSRDYASLSPRKRIGGGWGAYTAITGRGDLTGDHKADIVARDKKGALWLYKGTGNAGKPFADRSRIGGGWNKYTKLVSTGDVNRDGHADLLAVDGRGALWLYKGTGKASRPFASPVKIGKSGWNQFRLLY